MMILHVVRRELASRWILLPAAIAIGALAMIAIHSIGHVRGDADGIMNGTWIGTLVVSTIVGMSLLGDDLTNSRLSFYFARPFSPHAIFGGKLAAGVVVALLVQIAIVILVALALPELSWRGSALAQRDAFSVGGERALATIGCVLLGMAASIALGSKTRWFVVDALGLAMVGVIGTWFALRLEPDPAWLPPDSIRSVGEKALLHVIAFAVAVVGLGAGTARALVLGRTDRMRAHRTLSTTLWPIVVPAFVVLAAIAERTTPSIPDPPVLPSNVLVAPVVDTARVLASDNVPVTYLVVLDNAGNSRFGAAASWAKLDAHRARLSRPVRFGPPVDLALRFLMEQKVAGTSGDLAVASISVLDAEIEREWLRDKDRRPSPGEGWRWDYLASSLAYGVKSLAPIDGMAVDRDGPHFPQRLASVVGFVRAERIPRRRPLVLAPPTLKATSLIRIVAMTWATIAVSHAGRVRPLRLVFPGGYAGSTDWIEVRVSKSRIAVGTILDPPIELTHLEDLAAAIANVRAVQGGDTRQPVDVLVESDVDTQRLVDVLVALDVAGERMIGIGSIGPHDLALRGRRIPNTSVAYRGGYGDIRYGDIWETVRGNQAKVNRCYDEALVHDRNLSGVMTLTLFVESNRVTAAEATGVDPELAHCVAAAFRTLAVTTSPTNGSRSRRGHHTFEITFRI